MKMHGVTFKKRAPRAVKEIKPKPPHGREFYDPKVYGVKVIRTANIKVE